MNRTLSIAPMMACTDRHYRYFMRLITRETLLYTEMVTTGAVIHGNRARLLRYSPEEHPLAIQLGGSDPNALAQAAKIAEDLGYAEINLNVGCPSDRVQSGHFGACLMKTPDLVASCVKAMTDAVSIPVTVKTRLGVDDLDTFEFCVDFIKTIAEAGCQTFILHARKAWLQGLSPAENRTIPPLRYDWVYQLKTLFPHLEMILNGGVMDLAQAKMHLQYVDGVMIGRAAYANPFLFARADQDFYPDANACMTPDQQDVVLAYLPYVDRELAAGTRLRALTRHLVGLFQGIPGARSWRRYLSEHAGEDARGSAVVASALQCLAVSERQAA